MSLWLRNGGPQALSRCENYSANLTWLFQLDSQTCPFQLMRDMDEEELYYYEHPCNCSLPRDDVDHATASVKSAEAWTNFAPWIRSLATVSTLYPGELKNRYSRKGKSRLRILMAAATFGRFQWYLNNARPRTTLSARESALRGAGTCGNEALHAYDVSLPTFRLKLDLVMLSKLTSFDAARRIPMLRQINHGRVLGMSRHGSTEPPFQSFSK